MSEIIKMRGRGQLTLPKEVRDSIGVDAGDYLEIEVFPNRHCLTLRPVYVVAHGSPEAKLLREAARRDIDEGRYQSFDNADDVVDSLGWDEPGDSDESEAADGAEAPDDSEDLGVLAG